MNRRILFSRKALLPLLILLLIGTNALLIAAMLERDGQPHTTPDPVMPQGDLAADEQAVIDLFDRSSESVVHITSIDLWRSFWSNRLRESKRGSGSGFIWKDAQHIVTNYHVIQNADRAMVTLADGSTWEASVIGSAPDVDLAVLKIDVPADRLQPMRIGTSAGLKVGQKAYAIGNPFGLDRSLSAGVVSALDREIESVTRRPIRGVIQTDAAVNPGNSGGPLLNSSGLVIGVTTAIYSPSGTNAGIGFAIPIDTVLRVVPQLIEHGKLIRPGLGVTLAEGVILNQIGIKTPGVLVVGVLKGSTAEKSGLRSTLVEERNGRVRISRVGDLITAVNGQSVRRINDLYALFQECEVGQDVILDLERDGRSLKVTVKLQELE